MPPPLWWSLFVQCNEPAPGTRRLAELFGAAQLRVARRRQLRAGHARPAGDLAGIIHRPQSEGAASGDGCVGRGIDDAAEWFAGLKTGAIDAGTTHGATKFHGLARLRDTL